MITFVFGGRAPVTPLWNVCPSVQPVCAESILIDPPRANCAAGVAGGAGVGDPPSMYAPYAFTSANPTVLLSPSVNEAGRVPPLGSLVSTIAPSPPTPVTGFHTSHVPSLAA